MNIWNMRARMRIQGSATIRSVIMTRASTGEMLPLTVKAR